MQADKYRLAKGGLIDRSRRIHFTFNGNYYPAYPGDTLASALLANGVSLTARSFKYHRPRGIVGAWTEEPSTFVELEGEDQAGNHAVTTVQLEDGMRAKSVNCWPSPTFDLMSVNQLFSRLMPAAFYYKTFKWPDWHWFEPAIRRAAGLAAAPQLPAKPDVYETRFAHCDVLIVGAGPAGLSAALTAARTGVRVMLVDDDVNPGGSLLSSTQLINNQPACDWLRSVVDELDSYDNVTRLQSATAWACREHNMVLVTERKPQPASLYRRTWKVRTRQALFATGAIERNLVFTNNDRPGVMLCSAVSRYVNRYAVLPGQRIVIFTNNNSAYQTAAHLIAAGANLAVIVDSREQVSDQERSLVAGVEVLSAHEVVKTLGRKSITGISYRARGDTHIKKMDCDLLCVSGGWSPTVHLYSQSRGTLAFNDAVAAFLPEGPKQKFRCIGSAAGVFELSSVLQSSVDSVEEILPPGVKRTNDQPVAVADKDAAYDISALWAVEPMHAGDKAFVDIQNDVTASDIQLAIREGFGAVEHAKRYTTAGMGLDQGRTGNVNVIGIIASQSNVPLDEVGTTTFRSPFVPVEFGAIAGHREDSVILPYRHTPVTQWNIDNGACMYESGARWRRPGYFPLNFETFQQSVNRESLVVREGVGVYDGSPLGKFEIKGPDALVLLNMLYTNDFDNLKPGQGRYGIMLNEDGLIIDDGVTFKLAQDHYLMSSSTGHADAIYRHLEYFLKVERPQWKVNVTTVTAQWCNATVCGPMARELMNALECSFDLSAANFPFMAVRSGEVAGIPARVCRVSFTGELSFEINVASRHMLALWERIIEAGEPFDVRPIGSEANHVLRVEKGFLSLGHEVDGTADPVDLGMGWIVSKNKTDFIGKRAMEIRRRGAGVRRELVGLLTEDENRMIPEGAPLTPDGEKRPSEGLITASVWSVINNRVVSLALLDNGRARHGETVYVRLKQEVIKATVTAPCFHDPQGALLRS